MARKTTGHRGLHVRSKHAAQVPRPTKESLSVAEAARAVELLLDERLKGRSAGAGHPAVKGAFSMVLDHKILDHHEVTKDRKETVIPRTEEKEAPMVNVRRNGRAARYRGAQLRGAGGQPLGKEAHMASDHHRVKGAHPKVVKDHREGLSDRRGAARAHPRDTTRTGTDHPPAMAAQHQRVHAPTIRWSPRNPKWAKGLLNSTTLK